MRFVLMAIGSCLVVGLCFMTPAFIRVPFSIICLIIGWGVLVKKGIILFKEMTNERRD